MFNWLRKRKRKTTREDVEQIRTAPTKRMVEWNQLNEAVKLHVDKNKPYKELSEKNNQIAAERLLADLWIKKSQPKAPPQMPMILVPIYDWERIKHLRMSTARGEHVIQLSIEESAYTDQRKDKEHCYNAAILNKYYGVDEDDIFQLTGCVVDKKIQSQI